MAPNDSAAVRKRGTERNAFDALLSASSCPKRPRTAAGALDAGAEGREDPNRPEGTDGDEKPSTGADKPQGIVLEALVTEPSWAPLLEREGGKPYWRKLSSFVDEAISTQQVFPPTVQIFRALNECPLDNVRAVIIGQDPYHGPGQAEGLCFSVPRGQAVPSSLKNVYRELADDVGFQPPPHGNLEAWAKQGILLLNTVLTVQARQANSHAKQGWETFTDAALEYLSSRQKGLVFFLWGKPAQKRKKVISKSRDHVILEAPHPSGLSAHRGFFGCKHFSRCNAELRRLGREPIDWTLPP